MKQCVHHKGQCEDGKKSHTWSENHSNPSRVDLQRASRASQKWFQMLLGPTRWLAVLVLSLIDLQTIASLGKNLEILVGHFGVAVGRGTQTNDSL